MVLRWLASKGMKKSVVFNDPSGCTARCTTASPRVAGGVVSASGVAGSTPLPVVSTREPGPSERKAPAAQIPPRPVPSSTPASSLHIVVRCPAVLTPTTQPWVGVMSQCPPKAA